MEATELATLLFRVGTAPFILLGIGHGLLTLRDATSPRYFTPVADHVRVDMTRTPMKLTGRTSLWLAWLGFNFSHGLGLVAFGLSLLLVSLAAPRLPFTSTWLSPLSVAVSSVYFLLAIRYWFYVPALGAGLGAACFAVAWVLG